ncbi:MAG: carbohydrate ABC transporter permease [Clostridiales bacterium]|nr:carbohydrate ABC transporter permease [Clostridiales bacterium]
MIAEKKKRKKIDVGKCVMYLVVGLVVAVCLYPFLTVLAYSLSDGAAVTRGEVSIFPVGFQLTAYKEILKQTQIWTAMRVSIFVTIVGTALGLILTIFASYALSKPDLWGGKAITAFILFTMYFSGGMIPTFLIVKSVGLYDSIWSLILPSSMNVFNFIVMRTFFRQLPMELKEAAYIDGAGEMKILFQIVLPLSMPIIATIGLYYAVDYWNDYFSALLYIQSPEKYSLQLRLRQMLFAGDMNQLTSTDSAGVQVVQETLKMACIVVTTLPIIAVYPWLQKYFVKGVMVGSVKG